MKPRVVFKGCWKHSRGGWETPVTQNVWFVGQSIGDWLVGDFGENLGDHGK